MSTTTQIVIVDDHPVFRRSLIDLLSGIEDVEILAAVGTAAEALAVVADAPPHVVLLDLHLPDGSGIDLVRELRARFPDVSALVVTMVDDGDAVFRALRAGARGYLVKGAGQGEFVRALQAIRAGDVLIGSGVAERTEDLLATDQWVDWSGRDDDDADDADR